MGAGMLSNVCQRLSGDAEDFSLCGGRQRSRDGPRRGLESDGQLRGLCIEGRVFLEGRRHASIGGHGSGQVQDRFPDVHVDRTGRRGQLGQLAPGLRHAAGGEHFIHGLGLRVDVGKDLGQAVVHLAGYPLPLALDGQDLELIAKTDRLQCQANLGGQRRQGFHLDGVESAAAPGGDGHPEHSYPLFAVADRCGNGDLVARSQIAAQVVLLGLHGSASRLVANEDAGGGARGPETEFARGPVESQQRTIDSKQSSAMLDDRGDCLIGIGLAGDGDAHVVNGPQHRITRLQDRVPLAQVRGKPIDLAEAEESSRGHDGSHDRDHEERVERERQDRIEGRVAQPLDETDEKDCGGDKEPATAIRHKTPSWSGAVPSPARSETHPFRQYYAPTSEGKTRIRPVVLKRGTTFSGLSKSRKPFGREATANMS